LYYIFAVDISKNEKITEQKNWDLLILSYYKRI